VGALYNGGVRRVGPFEIIDRIGQGGTGTVWRAIHGPSGLPVAVKTVASEGWPALAQEIRAVAALDHPNVVAIYDQGAAHDPWFAMALAEGSLASWQPPLPLLLEVLRQVLSGLAHAHGAGLVHCDVKPANLLIARESGRLQVWVADFGIARRAGSGPRRSAGTPAFMAPEQFPGSTQPIGPSTDLYAVGCLAHQLVTGRPPFLRDDVQGLAAAHRYSPPPPLPEHAPAGLSRWVELCLRKDPALRFQTAADALAALDEALSLPLVPVSARSLPDTVAASGSSTWSGQTGELSPLAEPVPASEPEPRAPVAPFPARPCEPQRRLWIGRELSAGIGLFGVRQPRLVGRRACREAAWERLGALDGPAVVVIRGTPGVGRSALLRWWSHQAAESGAADVLRAADLGSLVAAAAGHADLPPQARSGWLERQARDEPSDAVAVLSPPGGAAGTALAARWLARRASHRRVLVAVDDAGVWAAQLASTLLDAFDAPILLAAVAPHASEDAEAAARWAEVGGRSGVLDLALGPLSEPDLLELVRDHLSLDGELGLRIVALSVGHPGTAMRIVGRAVCAGRLVPGPDGLRLAPGAELIGGDADRLALFDPAEQRLLEALAALGPGRPSAAWGLLTGEPDRVAALAERLVRSGLAVEQGGLTVTDAELLGEAEASARAGERWSLWHARAAELGGDAVRVARHELLAGRAEAALRRLAERARGAVTLDWALVELAEAAAAACPTERSDEAVLLRASLDLSRRRHEAALAGAQIAASSPEPAIRARALALAAAAGSRSNPAAARAHGEEALSAWEALGETTAADEVRITLAEIDIARDRPVAVEQLEGVIGRATGLTRARAAAMLAFARQRSGAPAIGAMREALAAAEACGSGFHVAAFENNLADLLRAAGHLEEAAEHYARAQHAFRRLGSPDEVVPRLNLALLAVPSEPARAWSELCAVAPRLARQGRTKLLGACRIVQVAALACLGRWDEALSHAHEANEILGQTGLVSPDIDAMIRVALDAEHAAGRSALAAAFAWSGPHRAGARSE
jgi:tetratricopeptide (TPR) repeat protein